MRLILRLAFVPVTALFLAQILSVLGKSSSGLIGFYFGYDSEFYRIFDLVSPAFFAFFVFWVAAQICFELIIFFRKNSAFPRCLKHLRYAPVAALTFSFFIVPLFDAGMIAYSKWQIANYVFDTIETIEKPIFELHSNYRGWCGNGFFANRSYLYYETASAELKNQNQNIRARALFATSNVADIFNGTDRERFDLVLSDACRDSSEIVRSVAENILNDGNKSCKNLTDFK